MTVNFSVISDLLARGFEFDENSRTMSFASGSIARYKKCTVYLDSRTYGDIAEDYFYSVEYESFAESGQPETDHHIIETRNVAKSKLCEFMRDRGIETDAEIKAEGIIRRQRMMELRLYRQRMSH